MFFVVHYKKFNLQHAGLDDSSEFHISLSIPRKTPQWPSAKLPGPWNSIRPTVGWGPCLGTSIVPTTLQLVSLWHHWMPKQQSGRGTATMFSTLKRWNRQSRSSLFHVETEMWSMYFWKQCRVDITSVEVILYQVVGSETH